MRRPVNVAAGCGQVDSRQDTAGRQLVTLRAPALRHVVNDSMTRHARCGGTFQRNVYHFPMRCLLFVIMIALLLVRGWTGDAMATEMALAPLQHQQLATKTIANHAHAISAEVHFHDDSVVPEAYPPAQAMHDCAQHSAETAHPAADGHCESCAACQACHTVALTTAALGPRPVFNAPTRPSAAAAPFASADMARGQKPPIS